MIDSEVDDVVETALRAAAAAKFLSLVSDTDNDGWEDNKETEFIKKFVDGLSPDEDKVLSYRLHRLVNRITVIPTMTVREIDAWNVLYNKLLHLRSGASPRMSAIMETIKAQCHKHHAGDWMNYLRALVTLVKQQPDDRTALLMLNIVTFITAQRDSDGVFAELYEFYTKHQILPLDRDTFFSQHTVCIKIPSGPDFDALDEEMKWVFKNVCDPEKKEEEEEEEEDDSDFEPSATDSSTSASDPRTSEPDSSSSSSSQVSEKPKKKRSRSDVSPEV